MLRGTGKTQPLLKAAFPFIFGVVIGFTYPVLLPFWFMFSAASLLLFTIFTNSVKSDVIASLVLHSMLIFCGFLLGQSRVQTYYSNPIYKLAQSEEEILFKARISRQNLNNDKRIYYSANIEYISIDGKSHSVKGDINLVFEHPIGLNFGERVSGKGILQPIPPPRNPFDFDAQRYSLQKKIYANLDVISYSIDSSISLPLHQKLILSVRRYISDSIDDYFVPPFNEILKGLTLGNRSGLDYEFTEILRTSGLWHLMSLSGLHLGIAAGFIFLLLSILNIPGQWRWGIAMFCLLILCIIAETRAPMLRALIIFSVFFLSRYFKRYIDPWNLLALSAIIIVLIEPAETVNAGFQLTYAAVAAILALASKWFDFVLEKFPVLRRRKILHYFISLSLASFAATLATAPLLAFHFGGIPLISILGSAIGVPLIALVLILAPLFLLGTIILPPAASLLANSIWLCLFILEYVVKIAAGAGLYYHTPNFGILELILLEITLFLIILSKRQWLWIGFLTANIFIWRGLLEPVKCRLTFFDVGQGNSALIELPFERNILIDTGPGFKNYNTGERIILLHLKRRGIENLDYIILSHDDKDHTAGTEAIMNNIMVDTVLVSEYHNFSSKNAEVQTVSRGDWKKIGGALMVFLNPSVDCGDDNDNSIVLALIFSGSKILFTGDISSHLENELLIGNRLIDSDLLLVSHHGSAYSSTTVFLGAVSPDYSVISAGKDNFYGHPSPEVIMRLFNINSSIHRTDKNGAAIYEISNGKIKKIAWR